MGADVPFTKKWHWAKVRVLGGVLKGFFVGLWVISETIVLQTGQSGRDCVYLCKIINMDLRDSRV